ncbi:MAG: LapA family protein [bacterium]
MWILVSFLIGFTLGAIYTWFVILKTSRKVVVDDIKEFIESCKEKIVNVILDYKDYLAPHILKKAEEEEKNLHLITPYGVV